MAFLGLDVVLGLTTGAMEFLAKGLAATVGQTGHNETHTASTNFLTLGKHELFAFSLDPAVGTELSPGNLTISNLKEKVGQFKTAFDYTGRNQIVPPLLGYAATASALEEISASINNRGYSNRPLTRKTVPVI